MRGLIIDPFAGISGDMFLGALVDLGLSTEWLRSFVASMELGAELTVEKVDRSGIACSRVAFQLPEASTHRHLSDVRAVIRGAEVEEPVRDRAESVFQRLAEAEAAVHGVPVESVHFHEVGALDSILDVLCVAAAVGELGYTVFYARPVAVGTGTVAMEHGQYPLPAPATARLLEGLTVRETGYPEECTTPTGAALLAELTGGTRAPSEVIYGGTGMGAGSRDPRGRPNCLRLQECRIPGGVGPDLPGAGQAVYALQADIDDLSAEYVAAARETLMEAGALDVTVLRVDMKKGRPGIRLEALAPESVLHAVVDAFFLGTSSIGLRFWRVERATLERSESTVQWRQHGIRVKRVTLPDGSSRWKPEYDDVAAAARAEGISPHEVRSELREGES